LSYNTEMVKLELMSFQCLYMFI